MSVEMNQELAGPFCQSSDKVSAHSSIPQPRENRFLSKMYAANSSTGLHHLANESGTATLCGLRVVPIIINRPAETGALHLTEVQPADTDLCEACVKLTGETNES